MNILNSAINNASKPAPKWFRIANTIFGNTETMVLTILMMNGFADNSHVLLEIKLISSFIRTNLGVVIANGQEYAQAGSTQAIQNADISKETVAEADTKSK